VTVAEGKYTLVAENCFENDPMAAWTLSDGAPPLTDVFEYSFIDSGEQGYGSRERVHMFTHLGTGIIAKVVCIFAQTVSTPIQFGGERLNIETLIDLNNDRADNADGFCPTGNLTQFAGDATVNEDGIACEEDLPAAHQLCRQLWKGSCTGQEVPLGTEKWCQVANLEPSPTRVQDCIDYINPTGGNTNKIANRWIELYCEANAPNRREDQSVSEWKKFCKNGMKKKKDYEAFVLEWGKGTYGQLEGPTTYCASSVEEYGKRADSTDCSQGISVEYFDGSDWVEVFYIPGSLLPCDGELEVPSTGEYFALFTNPVRFRQCGIDLDNCPVDSNLDAHCLANFGFQIQYEFDYNRNAVCP
ncbi:Uncharacterized protein (Fragment), partial [Durusdinium trenchii]